MSNTQELNLPELLGGCMCGAIRYVLKGAPEVVYYCHCNDCKRSTGSAFHVGLVMRTDHVEIVGDTLKGYTKLSDSGNHMTRLFCSKCGSPLFTKDSAAPENIVIKAGSWISRKKYSLQHSCGQYTPFTGQESIRALNPCKKVPLIFCTEFCVADRRMKIWRYFLPRKPPTYDGGAVLHKKEPRARDTGPDRRRWFCLGGNHRHTEIP